MLLSAKIDFGRVLKTKPISKDHLFKVYAAQNDLEVSRLGISLPKHRIKNATNRNTLKRKIRNTLDSLTSLSADIVFVYIGGSESYDAKIVNESIEHHKNIIQETAEKNWKT